MSRLLATLVLLFCSCVFARAQTVVCFGDSLTFGVGAPPGSAYPDFLRKDLTAAGSRATVVSVGLPGKLTVDGVDQLPAVLARHPAVVVLEFGANDAVVQVPVATIRHNLDTMIQALQHAKVRVLLAGIDLPTGQGPNYVRDHLQTTYLQQFYDVYPALAKQYDIPYIPFILQGVYGVPGLMSNDYLHPNAAGYQKVALNVLPGVEQLLR